ncbi:DUF499 domain-containing protein [Cyanobium sp. NIES-981]|uniref:DUF499 domain-containing protein n=1 Tax=Cyanobium sp. NIES-981 TaxID=1851505 RepID=UPI0007DCC27D|nr:DUF499 domain-containing protein [Cyanobium sp. NIES-981]SBO44248.1 ATPase (AAA+ superfamily)-like protein [Cyanobium sp. NIES-981]
MALSNRDRISKALELLRDGLFPYMKRELDKSIGSGWQNNLSSNSSLQDVSVLLKLFMDHWAGVFKQQLSSSDRSYVSELLVARNRWAHQEAFSSDDTDRTLDTAARLLTSIAAPEPAETLRTMREELQQQVYADRARNRIRYQSTTQNQVAPGLVPWREVITPHPDVISGKYQQAEFAADLDQVRRGRGSREYTDPVEFYRRTFITSGMKELLRIALQRLNGQGGDPVIELQTNFGGGKTHSMLALYHLCSGTPLANLPGLDEVCSEVGIHSVPKAARAVLVGTAFSPAEPSRKPDGTVVNTLWGEMAYQLGGSEGYELIASSDKQRVAPGAQDIAALFRAYAPCLVLVDEWVAYARQLVRSVDLPAGTYDSQVSFAQALTEAAKQVPNMLLLISVPQSTNEIGGSDGEKALDGLRNVVNRVAYEWRPATGNEGFEIVRRRLFETITTREGGASRDAVVRAFTDMYASQRAEFPAETREAEYRDLLTAAYPIHPELFRRLYDDWSTLDRFQRTRGVLRLLAKTIEGLWNGNSKDLLIMPSSVPMDDIEVKNELMRYLDNQWEPILSVDVDGPESTPARLDSDNPNFGRVSACKRVARSLYIGTAPDAETERKGIGDQRVKLACAMPGEPIHVFGDALRRLADRGRFIQQDGDRYWIDTRPNLNRTAEEYRESYLRKRDELNAELNQLLAKEAGRRGSFSGLHSTPADSGEVPDEPATRLVLLPPQATHTRGVDFSEARHWAASCLQSRGNAPRLFQNTLVFLAPDEKAIEDLYQALADRRAWQRIADHAEEMNITVAQRNQAISKIEDATHAISLRIPETWCHLLVPFQSEPGPGGASWDERRLSGGKGSLGERASQKCEQEDLLFSSLGARRIRQDLDRFLWKDRDSVSARELVDWCRKYLYLPRISGDHVILDALVSAGAALTGEATFHLADGFDEASGRYSGLRHQSASSSRPASLNTLLVKDEVAQVQIQAETKAAAEAGAAAAIGYTPDTPPSTAPVGGVSVSPGMGVAPPPPPPPLKPSLPTTYTASLKLDPVKAGLQMGQFLDEVMSHLQALPGAEIEMSLEVQARVPNGIAEATARIVLENSAALKVDKPGLY